MKFGVFAVANAAAYEKEYVNGGVLDLSWTDCGDASTHGTITGIDKTSITLGEQTTVTGSGTTDEAISGGDFTITAKASVITQTYQGKVCEAKEFDLPLGLGKVNWNGLSCPAPAGDLSVAVGVKLAAIIPSQYATADVTATATGASADDKLLCMSLHTSPAAATSVVSDVNGGVLDLSWTDCGDASTHGTITGIDKTSITLGEQTTVTGSGTTDEAISGGDFTITAKAGPITQTYQGKVCEAKEFDLPLGLGQVNWNGLSCPAPAGDLSVAVGVKLAAIIPSQFATADVTATATGASADDKLLCMSLHTSPAAATAEANLDCDSASCSAVCECALSQCSSQVNACLEDSTCATAQDCVLGCACGDVGCAAACAATAGPAAGEVLNCLTTSCSGMAGVTV